MIPTSVTNSPPAAGLAQNGAAIVVVGGGSAATAAAAAAAASATVTSLQSNYNCIVLGLASLILEGRPIADDEYQVQSQQQQHHQQLQSQSQQQQLTSAAGSSGRLSPRPSTSRAAINITTNPYALTSGTTRATYGYGHAASSGSSSSNSGGSYSGGSSSNNATHQRWTQKLCQLRQVSPAAQSMSAEPELVALAINDLDRRDFEIVRRVMLNRAGGGGGGGGVGGGAAGSGLGMGMGTVEPLSTNNSSAGSSPSSVSGSDNILHSLQSLATTCLRGGSPLPPAETRPLSLSLGYNSTAATATAANLVDYNCSRSSVERGVAIGMAMGMGAATRAAATATTTATASSDAAAGSANCNGSTSSSSSTSTSTSGCQSRPKHGPHCDQFLRKMGLAKGQESSDTEEHFCDMSYVNITCSRWRAHCLKMEAILARRENVCIEVYLGPAGHKILLEQWIISGKEKVPPPTMTLPSLCSAIRSQLYFSQIVAWCDLLRKSDPSVIDSGRVIFASNTQANNAGDLAGQSRTTGGTATMQRRPRLNIFYRIRAQDGNSGNAGNSGDAAFNAKANVHNFPHVNIAENFSVAVCVKSLPRFNGGLPHVATMSGCKSRPLRATPTASTPTGGGGMCAATPTGLGARIAISNTTPTTTGSGNGSGSGSGTRTETGTRTRSSCDKYMTREQEEEEAAVEEGEEEGVGVGVGEEEAEAEAEEEDANRDELDGHRERQLQKYRKRMQRRDKKRERKPSEQMEHMEAMDEGSDHNNSNNSSNSNGSNMLLTALPMNLTPPRRIAMISTGTQTSFSSCQQCGSEKTLLCLNCNTEDNYNDNYNDKHNDNDNDNDNDTDNNDNDSSESDMDDLSSSCSLSSCDLIVGTPRNKAELLLQAIQRTPKNRKSTTATTTTAATSSSKIHDLSPNTIKHPLKPTPPIPAATTTLSNNNQHKAIVNNRSGCQVCKRQKTQHTFSNSNGQKISSREANGQQQLQQQQQQDSMEHEQLQQSTSSKLTPNLNRCTLNSAEQQQERCQTPPGIANGCGMGMGSGEGEQLQTVGIAGIAGKALEHIVVQFKTPISHVPLKLQEYQQQQQQQQQQQLPLTGPKMLNQLRLNCGAAKTSSSSLLLDRETPPPMLSPMVRKGLPKVNLTTIFCSTSAPITIDNNLAFNFEAAATTGGTTATSSSSSSSLSQSQSQSQLLTPPENPNASNLMVQKSYSAPTLPNALSVSPRFAKQAAFYKRRSRHLSDRSDRSSLGSDEQLSDEDLESGMCSPAGSPLKTRARLVSQFTGRPLLGNLEESLLQKRLLPKIEVAGFRLQLGASGGFCPTQLTIPASSYFYELHGETLSTPYLCEIRLPRKGYFVPRSGTVQATLLNPMGTVVRMFVIPYDMHDMPPLHRTFIRQRILAEELNPCVAGMPLHEIGREREREREREPVSPTAPKSTTSKLGHFISAEQMKRLRYSIHLRFQTSRSGRLSLHTDIRLLISRRTDCDTAAAHAKGLLEAPNELVTDTLMPQEPRYNARQESAGRI